MNHGYGTHSYGGSGAYKSNCTHFGPTEVFTMGKCAIWAGTGVEVGKVPYWDLIISCNNSTNTAQSSPVKVTEAAKLLVPKELFDIKPPPLLSIDWPDRGLPPLPASWWVNLVNFLKSQEEEWVVAVHCTGGHGRTGTALACLLALSGELPEKADPVKYIRKHYCQEAVESSSQIAYIEGLLGRKIKSKPSDYVAPATGKGSNVGGTTSNWGNHQSGGHNHGGHVYDNKGNNVSMINGHEYKKGNVARGVVVYDDDDDLWTNDDIDFRSEFLNDNRLTDQELDVAKWFFALCDELGYSDEEAELMIRQGAEVEQAELEYIEADEPGTTEPSGS